MDMRKIKKLIELIQSTGVAEIEIREGEESVRITRETKSSHQAVMMQHPIMPAPSIHQPDIRHAEPASRPTGAAAHAAEPPPAAPHAEKQTLKSPMVGTVYLSPTPGAKPFVEVGQSVKPGDVICLIEAMKMFNQIEADKGGVITGRLVDNGTPVEFNQPLFTIE